MAGTGLTFRRNSHTPEELAARVRPYHNSFLHSLTRYVRLNKRNNVDSKRWKRNPSKPVRK